MHDQAPRGLGSNGSRWVQRMTGAHAARTADSKATRVKNEGAFPFVDARTARIEEGSDDDTLMPPAYR